MRVLILAIVTVGLFLHVRPNYIHSTSNDIHTDGARARAKTGGDKGIRGDRRFKGRGEYPVETSYNCLHQNTKNLCSLMYQHT